MAGKSVSDPNAAAAGAAALAYHTRCVAKYYGVPVVLHGVVGAPHELEIILIH